MDDFCKDILLIIIEIFALGIIIWQTQKTFENERKITTAHFLKESKLNSTVAILENINLIESYLEKINKYYKKELENRKNIIKHNNNVDENVNQIKKNIKDINTPMTNIELYISFIPELKDDFDLFKIIGYEYVKKYNLFLETDKNEKIFSETQANTNEIERKQKELEKQLLKLKHQLINLYSKIIKNLNHTLNK